MVHRAVKYIEKKNSYWSIFFGHLGCVLVIDPEAQKQGGENLNVIVSCNDFDRLQIFALAQHSQL